MKKNSLKDSIVNKFPSLIDGDISKMIAPETYERVEDHTGRIPEEYWESIESKDLLAMEAFLRRWAELSKTMDIPLMLKGSLVTRQFLNNVVYRHPMDIDCVYTEKIETAEEASQKFSELIDMITAVDLDDGVTFQRFSEDAFWRGVDYAMPDDFPTVNTNICCMLNGEIKLYLSLDISFNLELPSPVPLEYIPVLGKSFLLPSTVPLYLQVAWKLHQTVVRPRSKDLSDLYQLLTVNPLDESTLALTLDAFIEECNLDKEAKPEIIQQIFTGKFAPILGRLDRFDKIDPPCIDATTTFASQQTCARLKKIFEKSGINQETYHKIAHRIKPTKEKKVHKDFPVDMDF